PIYRGTWKTIGLDDSRQSISRLGESRSVSRSYAIHQKPSPEDCPTGDGHRQQTSGGIAQDRRPSCACAGQTLFGIAARGRAALAQGENSGQSLIHNWKSRQRKMNAQKL